MGEAIAGSSARSCGVFTFGYFSSRAGGEDPAREAEHVARDAAAVGQVAVEVREHDVVAAVERVDAAVLDVDVDAQVRIAREHLAGHGAEVMRAELVRRRNAQAPGDGVAACRGVGAHLAQALEHGRRVLVERLAGLGGAHAPRRALQQARPELALEPGDRGADARLGTRQRLRRGRKAAMLEDAAEGIDVVPVHCSVF